MMRNLFSRCRTSNPLQWIIATAIVFSSASLRAEMTVVDQIVGMQSPTRITLSSAGAIFVSDHDRGEVIVYDSTGKNIAKLDDADEPLGLAILEVAQPVAPAAPGMSPAECQEMVKNFAAKVAKFKDKQSRYEDLLAKLIARKANPKKIKKIEDRVSAYQQKVNKYEEKVNLYQACSDPQPPQPLLPVIYVGDEEDGSVQVINNGEVTTLGAGAGEFNKPNGIAITADGQAVYVVDSAADLVKVYDGTGALQSSFGSKGTANGQFNFPIDIAINEAAGELYVTDFWNSRVVVFDLAGTWLRNIAAPQNDAGDPAFNRPSGVGIDPAGNLYVVDNALSCVVIMSNQGVLNDIIGYSNGQYWTGTLALPLDAAADGQRVYVTSGQDGVVKIFEEVAQ